MMSSLLSFKWQGALCFYARKIPEKITFNELTGRIYGVNSVILLFVGVSFEAKWRFFGRRPLYNKEKGVSLRQSD